MPATAVKCPYTLKNVKTLRLERGDALTATLYRDGVKVGTIEDRGDGGAAWVYMSTAAEQTRYQAWNDSLNDGPEAADTVILTMAEHIIEARTYDRHVKAGKLVYRKKGQPDYEYGIAPLRADLKALTLSQVCKIYRRHAPWWGEVAAVWVTGQGWKDPAKL